MAVNEFTDDVNVIADNKKVMLGAGSDASIYYDGTDFIFDAREVGTGDFKLGDKVTIGGVSGVITWGTAAGGTAGTLTWNGATDATILGQSGKELWLGANGTPYLYIDITGQFGVNETVPEFQIDIDGTIGMKERAAAEADVAGKGQLWVKTATPNELWFTNDAGQDIPLGAGAEAYSALWTHDVPANQYTLTISTQDIWTKYDDFTNVGHEDSNANLVGDSANDKIVVGALGGGEYHINCSLSVVGAVVNKDYFFGVARDFATPIAITSNTLASPTVITTGAAHDLEVGDSVIQTGSDDANINGTFMVGTVPSGTTYTLTDFAGTAIDSGAGGTGGAIDTEVHGSLISHRRLTSTADIGSVSITGEYEGVASDEFYVVVLNRTDTNNVVFQAVSFVMNRVAV